MRACGAGLLQEGAASTTNSHSDTAPTEIVVHGSNGVQAAASSPPPSPGIPYSELAVGQCRQGSTWGKEGTLPPRPFFEQQPVCAAPRPAGVPGESWPGERRVALTPAGAGALLKAGFRAVVVQRGAGEQANFSVRRGRALGGWAAEGCMFRGGVG